MRCFPIRAGLLALLLPLAARALPAPGLPADPAQVLADAPRSGAVTMMPGETYFGPGPLTVGYLGAKKQIVLPAGAWVLLALHDSDSTHHAPVPLVSMAFGRFEEGRLVSLVSYLFNGRASQPRARWSEADKCLAAEPPAGGEKVAGEAGRGRGCGWTVRQGRPPNVTDGAWVQALSTAARLGARVPDGPLQFTRVWAVDGGPNLVALRRADYGLRGAAAAASQAQRVAWLRAYLPVMMDGLDKRIDATELEPNQPQPPPVRLTLPD